ncbi:MAG: polysaccharide deacetylase family protein [Lachnospiraceae bacterium]|nr:polysaccharide deacetylase family protein [Lachnospiraceae bacterium]
MGKNFFTGIKKKSSRGNGLLWMMALLAIAVVCAYLPIGDMMENILSTEDAVGANVDADASSGGDNSSDADMAGAAGVNEEENNVSGNSDTDVADASTEGRVLPIYSVETEEKVVAISFDCAWGDEYTQILLDILAEYEVTATFFMTGGWIESYPDDVKAIAAAGHDLGNHSENHKNMSQLSTTEIASELLSPHEKVKELTGIEMELFRPPYGDYDNEVINTAADCGYYSIQWDVDSLDWKDYGTESIINTVLNHKSLQNGSIILMHNGAKYTHEALPTIIEGLQAQGYTLVPISELILRENYHMDHTGRQIAD